MSAGFTTIFESDECRFDFSAKAIYLRKNLYKRIDEKTLVKVGEEMYRYVETLAEIDYIKNAVGKWIPYRNGKMSNVIVYERVDANDFITGWYLTVIKSKNPDGTNRKRNRYFKKVGVK